MQIDTSTDRIHLIAAEWFVAHTRPRCEKKLVEYCGRLRVSASLPCYTSRHRYRGKTVAFEKPLFPGYVFLQVEDAQRHELQRCDHLVQLLQVHDQEQLVRQLKDIEIALDAGLEMRAVPEIGAGDKVKIKSGALAGVEGWVEARYGLGTVLLRLDFIGQAAAVKLDAIELELV